MQWIYVNRVPFEQINMGWLCKLPVFQFRVIAVFQYCVLKTVIDQISKCWIYQQQHNYGWQAGAIPWIYVNRVPFEQINMGWLRKLPDYRRFSILRIENCHRSNFSNRSNYPNVEFINNNIIMDDRQVLCNGYMSTEFHLNR